MARSARELMRELFTSGTGGDHLRIIMRHLQAGGADTGTAAVAALTAALGASHKTVVKATALDSGGAQATDFHLGAGDQGVVPSGGRDFKQMIPDVYTFLYG
jgi:hypothetical protein